MFRQIRKEISIYIYGYEGSGTQETGKALEGLEKALLGHHTTALDNHVKARSKELLSKIESLAYLFENK